MSKDPAFLFYSSDFLTGTMFLSDEQVGKYIRLLCSQHQHGHMTKKDMIKICKTYDEDIFEKFAIDEDGKYYNDRLEREITKRVAYSESRRKNRTVKDKDMINTSSSYDEHMENENINRDIEDKESAERKRNIKEKPTIEEISDYCRERNKGIDAEQFFNFYEAKGWMIGKNKMKDWKAAVRTWEKTAQNNSRQTVLPLVSQRSPSVSGSGKSDWERFKERAHEV